MFAFGTHPRFAVRTAEENPTARAGLIFSPRPSLFGGDGAFHVDALAATVGSRARFQLRDLVRFATGVAGLIHSVRFRDHDDARCEPRTALVTASPRHEFQCCAMAKVDRLHTSTARTCAALGQQVSEPGTLDYRQDIQLPLVGRHFHVGNAQNDRLNGELQAAMQNPIDHLIFQLELSCQGRFQLLVVRLAWIQRKSDHKSCALAKFCLK